MNSVEWTLTNDQCSGEDHSGEGSLLRPDRLIMVAYPISTRPENSHRLDKERGCDRQRIRHFAIFEGNIGTIIPLGMTAIAPHEHLSRKIAEGAPPPRPVKIQDHLPSQAPLNSP